MKLLPLSLGYSRIKLELFFVDIEFKTLSGRSLFLFLNLQTNKHTFTLVSQVHGSCRNLVTGYCDMGPQGNSILSPLHVTMGYTLTVTRVIYFLLFIQLFLNLQL